MKKVLYILVVGMLFLGSLVVSGVTVDNNDTSVDPRDNFGDELIPCMGTFNIYVWDQIRYDVELDDEHFTLYNDTWSSDFSSNKTKYVRFDWIVHKEPSLTITGSFSHTFFWRVREWPRPPFSVLTFFMRHTGNVRVNNSNSSTSPGAGPTIPERKLLNKLQIEWSGTDTFPKKGSEYVEIYFQAFPSDINLVAFMWAGKGFDRVNWDFSVAHLHFYAP